MSFIGTFRELTKDFFDFSQYLNTDEPFYNNLSTLDQLVNGAANGLVYTQKETEECGRNVRRYTNLLK